MDVNNILDKIKENTLSEKTWNKTTAISYEKKEYSKHLYRYGWYSCLLL